MKLFRTELSDWCPLFLRCISYGDDFQVCSFRRGLGPNLLF